MNDFLTVFHGINNAYSEEWYCAAQKQDLYGAWASVAYPLITNLAIEEEKITQLKQLINTINPVETKEQWSEIQKQCKRITALARPLLSSYPPLALAIPELEQIGAALKIIEQRWIGEELLMAEISPGHLEQHLDQIAAYINSFLPNESLLDKQAALTEVFVKNILSDTYNSNLKKAVKIKCGMQKIDLVRKKNNTLISLYTTLGEQLGFTDAELTTCSKAESVLILLTNATAYFFELEFVAHSVAVSSVFIDKLSQQENEEGCQIMEALINKQNEMVEIYIGQLIVAIQDLPDLEKAGKIISGQQLVMNIDVHSQKILDLNLQLTELQNNLLKTLNWSKLQLDWSLLCEEGKQVEKEFTQFKELETKDKVQFFEERTLLALKLLEGEFFCYPVKFRTTLAYSREEYAEIIALNSSDMTASLIKKINRVCKKYDVMAYRFTPPAQLRDLYDTTKEVYNKLRALKEEILHEIEQFTKVKQKKISESQTNLNC